MAKQTDAASDADANTPATDGPDENQIIAERRSKLDALRGQVQAYPNDFAPTDTAAALHLLHDQTNRDTLQAQSIQVALAGRMMLKRVQGKASFATIQDPTGRIQIYLNNNGVGAQSHAAFKHWIWATSLRCAAKPSRP